MKPMVVRHAYKKYRAGTTGVLLNFLCLLYYYHS